MAETQFLALYLEEGQEALQLAMLAVLPGYAQGLVAPGGEEGWDPRGPLWWSPR